MKNQLEVLLAVARVLDELEIPYMVVGSVASSLLGFSRATADVDVVADIEPHHIASFYAALKDEFYVDEQMIRQAVGRRRMFNLIHLDSLFKVDVYLPRDDFSRRQLARRRAEKLFPDTEQTINLATPEDVILAKLQWYRRGGEVSERQLADAAGIVKVQAERLDMEYLRALADELNIADLLEKILEMAR